MIPSIVLIFLVLGTIFMGLATPAEAGALGVVGGDFGDLLVSQTPLGRMGQPDDIGPVAVFLASDDARWVTGEILGVAGGLR